MSPIAAYYVMVFTDHDRKSARHRHARPVRSVARSSMGSRIVHALEVLARLGRPSTSQPI